MKRAKDEIIEICSLLNNNKDKSINKGIRTLCLFIINNDSISDDEYNNYVRLLIENNYFRVIYFLLCREVENVKSSKIIQDVDLEFIEIIFYTLNWVFRKLFGGGNIYTKDKNEFDNGKIKVSKFVYKDGNIETYIKNGIFEESHEFSRIGILLCENLKFVEVIALANISYNAIYILNCIFYFLLYHKRFNEVFLRSPLLLSLIKIRENLEDFSNIKNNENIFDSMEEENIDNGSDMGDKNELYNGSDIMDIKEKSDGSSDVNNKIDESDGKKKKKVSNNTDEILICNYSFEKELVFLYKHLALKNLKRQTNKNINQVSEICDFYGELLIRKQNGESKIFKEEMINVEKKIKKIKKKLKKIKGNNNDNIRDLIESGSDFEIMRVTILIYFLYCYLFIGKNHYLHKNFEQLCNEIYEIYRNSIDVVKLYILLCTYEILKKGEHYKYINIFLVIMKLQNNFLNNIQIEMKENVTFILNEVLKYNEFSHIYKKNKFNDKVIFLLKLSKESYKETDNQLQNNFDGIMEENIEKSKRSYILVINFNRKQCMQTDNNYNDTIINFAKNVKRNKFEQINNNFLLLTDKKEIHRICMIFKIIELYVKSCSTEIHQLFVISPNLKEEENVKIFKSNTSTNNNSLKIGKPHNNKKTMNDNLFALLTDLNVKYFLNHYVIVKTLEKHKHFINMYYNSSRLYKILISGNIYIFIFLNLYIELNKIFFIYKTKSNFGISIKNDERNVAFDKLFNRIAECGVTDINIGKSICSFNYEKTENEYDEINNGGEHNLTPSNKSKKRRVSIKGDNIEDETTIIEKNQLKRKQPKQVEQNENNINFENKMDKNETDKMCQQKYQYKYIYQRIKDEIVHKTNFLVLCKEVVNLKIVVELYKNKKKKYIYNNNEIIHNEDILIQNMKEENDYIYSEENEINYKKKLEELLFFFIPMQITKYLLKFVLKKERHYYFNYSIMSYLYYIFEIYKCISLFILSLQSYINIPKGINNEILLKSIKLDLSIIFYNIISPYYLLDITYINICLSNSINNVETHKNGNTLASNDNNNKGVKKDGKHNINSKKKTNFEEEYSSGNDSDNYVFNIEDKTNTMLMYKLDKKKEEKENLLNLHYFINNVYINNNNSTIFYFIVLRSFINLFDECELKKKLIYELYNKKTILEINNFTLFSKINDNIYKIFLKLFIEKRYFTIESYNLVNSLFHMFIYYKNKVIVEKNEAIKNNSKNYSIYEKYYNFMENLVYKILKKTKYFDNKHLDILFIFLIFLRSINNSREFLIVISVFLRIFNLFNTKITHLEVYYKSERSKKCTEENVINYTAKKRRITNYENSSVLGLIIDYFFTNNIKSLCNNIPILKVFNDNNSEKEGQNNKNNTNLYEYTVNDVVQLYKNYVNFVKYIILFNPYIYLKFKNKLKNKKCLSELFFTITKKGKNSFTNSNLDKGLQTNDNKNNTSHESCNKPSNNDLIEKNKKDENDNNENIYFPYKQEMEEYDETFQIFLKFQKSVKLFLKEIKLNKNNDTTKYKSKIEKICTMKMNLEAKNNEQYLMNNKDDLLKNDKGNNIDCNTIRELGEVLSKCKNVLKAYLNEQNIFPFDSKCNEENGNEMDEEVVFYKICNITHILINYYYINYIYIKNNDIDNINIDIAIYLIKNINFILKVYLKICMNINIKFSLLMKRNWEYIEIENMIMNRKNLNKNKFHSNQFIEKINKMNKKMFIYFLNIFKNESFKNLLSLLENVGKKNRDVYESFIYLNLCYIYKNVYFCKLKKENHINVLVDNLTFLINAIVRHDINRTNVLFKKNICNMVFFLLKKLQTKECFINKLIMNSYFCNKIKNNIEDTQKQNDKITSSEKFNDFEQIDKSNQFIVEEALSFFLYYMSNENIMQSHLKNINENIISNTSLLINNIIKNKGINVTTKIAVKKLWNLYINKIYSYNDLLLNYDLIKNITIFSLSNNLDSNNKNNDMGAGKNNLIIKKIKNDKIHFLNYKDIEREIKSCIIYNYMTHFGIETLKDEENVNMSKENYIIMYILYFMKNYNECEFFDKTHINVLEKITYKKVLKLKKHIFTNEFGEMCLNKIIYSYTNVRNKNKIDFLLLNTKRMRNKNCLFVAMSILYFLGNLLKMENRVTMFNKYNKNIIRRICKVVFLYFYEYFFENDVKKNKHIFKSYNRVVFFTYIKYFKQFKKNESNSNIEDNDESYKSDHVNNEQNPRINKFVDVVLKGNTNDFHIMLMLLLNLINKNKNKFNIENVIDKRFNSVLVNISNIFKRNNTKNLYYTDIMKEYIYTFCDSDMNNIVKYKENMNYISFNIYFLLFKYMKLRDLNLLNMIESFFKDEGIEKTILSQIDEYKKKKKKNDEKILIYILKLIKIFYEEWYSLCKNKTESQNIYLKTLNKNIFNELKKLYNYTLGDIDICIRNIFFVDLSYFLKSITIKNMLDNKLMDEVLKFKDFNLDNDNNHNWLDMNPKMLYKTCTFFFVNENIRNELGNNETYFTFYKNMKNRSLNENYDINESKNEENYDYNDLQNNINKIDTSNNLENYDDDNYNDNNENNYAEDINDDKNDKDNEIELGKMENYLKNLAIKNLYSIIYQNDYIKKEVYLLSQNDKLKDNIYDYLFLLCLIVSKLIFCFILMAEKLRIFFYHFRILYTTNSYDNIFLNYDLLYMQEVNRKIKNYIKKYPDIHFYIDYDNNEKEENKGYNNTSYYSYNKNAQLNGEENFENSYNNKNEVMNSENNSGLFTKNKKLISYDEEKEHFHHLKKGEKYSMNCKFCIKFRKVHKIHKSYRIFNLFNEDEKNHIKNMIYYGKTIRTTIFLNCPYENNIYSNFSTFINGQEYFDDTNEKTKNDETSNIFDNSKSEKVDKMENNDGENDDINIDSDKKNDTKDNKKKNKENHIINKINSYCIVDNNDDLLYGKKIGKNHFKRNYKRLLNQYLLDDIDFFGKWIKNFSIYALKILICCLSSNDIIVRIISLKGLSIFYQLIENSFFLYKIKKKLNSFRGKNYNNTDENNGIYKEFMENSIARINRNNNNNENINLGIGTNKKNFVIPFKELFYLYFFMKKLKYSVDQNSYYINPCISSYSIFLLNDLYNRANIIATLKHLIINKTFSVYFFYAYLDKMFTNENLVSLKLINFFIISVQSLYSIGYNITTDEKECDGEESQNQNFNNENNDEYYSERNNNYEDEYANNNRRGNYTENKNNNHVDKSFFVTSNIGNRMIHNFENEEDDNDEEIEDKMNDEEENVDKPVLDKLQHIEESHKNAVNCIYSILNKKQIFEIYMSMFFNNYSNYNLLKNFLILLITSTNVIDVVYMKHDDINCTEPCNGNQKDQLEDNIYCDENENNNNSHVIDDKKNYDDNEEDGWTENKNIIYKDDDNFNENDENKNYDNTNMNNIGVQYYVKNNFVIKLITKNNIFLWINSLIHKKLFQEENSLNYPSSFIFPILNFYDLTNKNENFYVNYIYKNIKNFKKSTVKLSMPLFLINQLKFIENNMQILEEKNYDEMKNDEEKIENSYNENKEGDIEDPNLRNTNKDEKIYSDNDSSNSETVSVDRNSNSITDDESDIYKNEYMNGNELSMLQHLDDIIKKWHMLGHVFKENYGKTSGILLYLSLLTNNIVSNLFYPSVDYSHIFGNSLLKEEKEKIKKFILKNGYNLIYKKNENNNKKFEIWNFWYNNFHKCISLKIRGNLLIHKKDISLRNSNLNIFSEILKIIRKLNRSLYYTFFNLYHTEYYNLFIFISGKKKYIAKKNIYLKKTISNYVKICKKFIKYIYLLFNMVFNICTSLYDTAISNDNIFQNSISTKVIVDKSFMNNDISLIVNEFILFFENICIILNYFNSQKMKKDSTDFDIEQFKKGEYEEEEKNIQDRSRTIETFYVKIHTKLLKETYNKIPQNSNYFLYRKIILCVLQMIHKNCFKNNKHFYYIFLNKLITMYHFINVDNRPKLYLYIFELYNIIKKDPFESILKQIF
ncbi:hypothetical protein YYC_02766 [Plasmodium yoelii 17X]|uniref:Uncharacterized protein n=1 Tax=Plasmodium yoelii 17X TaxID=1323249 RepID=V7PM28_PLAYE|nr:hypothetical protein YYC_02766 [Plasmodium yoelii 17X]